MNFALSDNIVEHIWLMGGFFLTPWKACQPLVIFLASPKAMLERAMWKLRGGNLGACSTRQIASLLPPEICITKLGVMCHAVTVIIYNLHHIFCYNLLKVSCLFGKNPFNAKHILNTWLKEQKHQINYHCLFNIVVTKLINNAGFSLLAMFFCQSQSNDVFILQAIRLFVPLSQIIINISNFLLCLKGFSLTTFASSFQGL